MAWEANYIPRLEEHKTCIFDLACVLREYFSLRIMPRILEALATIFSMCLLQLPLLLRVKPRCLCSVAKLIGIPSKKIWGKLKICFKVNRMPSVLRELKFTSHCLA